MPLTRPIPKSAAPIVRCLRKDVSRPWKPPEYVEFALRWLVPTVRNGVTCLRTVCPMGLHPKSRCGTPIVGTSFAGGKYSHSAVTAFYGWWDAQDDARAAVDAVWPRQKNKKKPTRKKKACH